MRSLGLRLVVAATLAAPWWSIARSVARADPASPGGEAPAGAPNLDPVDRGVDEARLVQLLNRERARAKLPPLSVDRGLAARAKEHAMGMATQGKLFHHPLSELPEQCSGARAQNVGRAASPDIVHELFMQDLSHRAEVLGPFNRVEIGRAHV